MEPYFGKVILFICMGVSLYRMILYFYLLGMNYMYL